MDYKQKYEKALETVQEILSSGADLIRIKRLKLRLQSVFPELKENEDERIRKAIHIYLDWLDGCKDYAPKGSYSIKDMITWLEKQNKQNFSNIPSRETILAIWELGNDWKTLTKGVIEDFYSSRPSRLEYNTEMNQFYYAHESEKEGEHGYQTITTAPHHLCHYFVHMVGDLQREGLLKKHMTAEEMHRVWLSIVGTFPTPTKMSDQFIDRNFEVRYI